MTFVNACRNYKHNSARCVDITTIIKTVNAAVAVTSMYMYICFVTSCLRRTYVLPDSGLWPADVDEDGGRIRQHQTRTTQSSRDARHGRKGMTSLFAFTDSGDLYGACVSREHQVLHVLTFCMCASYKWSQKTLSCDSGTGEKSQSNRAL